MSATNDPSASSGPSEQTESLYTNHVESLLLDAARSDAATPLHEEDEEEDVCAEFMHIFCIESFFFMIIAVFFPDYDHRMVSLLSPRTLAHPRSKRRPGRGHSKKVRIKMPCAS